MDGKTKLTKLEKEVLQLVADGHNNSAISHITGRTVSGVESARKRIIRKRGLQSAAQLVSYAAKSEAGAVTLADVMEVVGRHISRVGSARYAIEADMRKLFNHG